MYHSFRSQWLFGMSPYHQCRPCCSVLLHLSLSMIYLIPSSMAFNDAYSYCPRLTERLRICLDLCQRRPSLDWSLGLTSGYDCTGYPGWEEPTEALVTLLWNCEDAFFFSASYAAIRRLDVWVPALHHCNIAECKYACLYHRCLAHSRDPPKMNEREMVSQQSSPFLPLVFMFVGRANWSLHRLHGLRSTS